MWASVEVHVWEADDSMYSGSRYRALESNGRLTLILVQCWFTASLLSAPSSTWMSVHLGCWHYSSTSGRQNNIGRPLFILDFRVWYTKGQGKISLCVRGESRATICLGFPSQVTVIDSADWLHLFLMPTAPAYYGPFVFYSMLTPRQMSHMPGPNGSSVRCDVPFPSIFFLYLCKGNSCVRYATCLLFCSKNPSGFSMRCFLHC